MSKAAPATTIACIRSHSTQQGRLMAALFVVEADFLGVCLDSEFTEQAAQFLSAPLAMPIEWLSLGGE